MDKRHDIYRKEEPPKLAGRRSPQPAFRREWRKKYKTAGGSDGVDERGHAPLITSKDGHHHIAFTDHQHRRRRSAHASWGNRILILGLVLVLVGYVSFLVYSRFYPAQLKARSGSNSLVAKPGAETKPEVPVAPPPPADSIVPDALKQKIGQWKSGVKDVMAVEELIESGETDKALERARAILNRSPDNLDAKTMLAQALIVKKRLGEAENLLLEILETNPDKITARKALALVLYEQGNFESAVELAAWTIEADNLALDMHELIAKSYMKTGQLDKAIEFYRRLSQLDPLNTVVVNNLALAYSKTGDFDKAIKLYMQMLEKDNSSSITYFNLAACYARLNRTGEAVDLLARASDRFGSAFVKTWMAGEEFAGIRDHESFKALEALMGAAPKAPPPEPAVPTNAPAGA